MSDKKHNYKLSSEDKKAILLEYDFNHNRDNIKAICSKYNITRQSLYNIVNQNKDGNNEICITDHKENFTKRANEIIALMLDRLYKEIKDTDNKITIAQLTTSLGILYDKMRLNDNQSTSNSSININIKID